MGFILGPAIGEGNAVGQGPAGGAWPASLKITNDTAYQHVLGCAITESTGYSLVIALLLLFVF